MPFWILYSSIPPSEPYVYDKQLLVTGLSLEWTREPTNLAGKSDTNLWQRGHLIYASKFIEMDTLRLSTEHSDVRMPECPQV